MMLLIFIASCGIGYVIYEDTLTAWWIPLGMALLIALVTIPFYKKWIWLTTVDGKVINCLCHLACIAAVLLIVSLIIISNTIKLAMFDRREEIAIMRMVGATNGFIRLPFVVEGFILGLLGAVCSFFLEWGLYEAIRGAIASSGQLSFLHVVSFSTVVLPVALVCVVTGLLIGVVGSLMSIRKFLKV